MGRLSERAKNRAAPTFGSRLYEPAELFVGLHPDFPRVLRGRPLLRRLIGERDPLAQRPADPNRLGVNVWRERVFAGEVLFEGVLVADALRLAIRHHAAIVDRVGELPEV